MVTTLRVVLDPLVGPPSLGGRYAERLTRALAAHAPAGSSVAGVIGAVPDDEAAAIERSLPGLSELHRIRLGRRELRAAWQHGITLTPGRGLLHATDLTAPLARHDRRVDPDSQTVVTIADTVAWTEPDALEPAERSRRRAMGRRAERYADAIVVPSHAVAERLSTVLAVGDRLRIVAAAPRPGLGVPDDAAALRDELGLPDAYVATVLPDSAAGWEESATALAEGLPRGVDLVIVAADPVGDAERSPRATRVTAPDDRRLAALLTGAAAYVDLGAETGFGIPLLEAMALGVPVVHRTEPDAVELVADAGLAVDGREALTDAVRSVLSDEGLESRLSTLGRDRAGVFSWRDTAEKIWQLHADL